MASPLLHLAEDTDQLMKIAISGWYEWINVYFVLYY
jgi:hypothetical protein